MNEYDSNRIYDLTSTIGYNKTQVKEDADCFVLNTFHIRKKATEKVYDEIGRVKKYFKNSKKPIIIISGCVAQAESKEMITHNEPKGWSLNHFIIRDTTNPLWHCVYTDTKRFSLGLIPRSCLSH